MKIKFLYQWTLTLPILACILYLTGLVYDSAFFQILAGFLLIGSVMSNR